MNSSTVSSRPPKSTHKNSKKTNLVLASHYFARKGKPILSSQSNLSNMLRTHSTAKKRRKKDSGHLLKTGPPKRFARQTPIGLKKKKLFFTSRGSPKSRKIGGIFGQARASNKFRSKKSGSPKNKYKKSPKLIFSEKNIYKILKNSHISSKKMSEIRKIALRNLENSKLGSSRKKEIQGNLTSRTRRKIQMQNSELL